MFWPPAACELEEAIAVSPRISGARYLTVVGKCGIRCDMREDEPVVAVKRDWHLKDQEGRVGDSLSEH